MYTINVEDQYVMETKHLTNKIHYAKLFKSVDDAKEFVKDIYFKYEIELHTEYYQIYIDNNLFNNDYLSRLNIHKINYFLSKKIYLEENKVNQAIRMIKMNISRNHSSDDNFSGSKILKLALNDGQKKSGRDSFWDSFYKQALYNAISAKRYVLN